MTLIADTAVEVNRPPSAPTFRSPSTDVSLAAHLSCEDSRLLLIASLTLFLRRARHGIRVTGDDLVRLARFADSIARLLEQGQREEAEAMPLFARVSA